MESENAPQAASPKPTPSWWKWVGMRRGRGRLGRFVVPTLWGWVILLVVAGVGSFGGFLEYSMKPDFCRSCHLMEPYYQAWHASSHRGVSCAECHFAPGFENTLYGKWQASSQAVKFLTNTYGSKPHAEIQDASCMRSGCHEQRLLEGRVKWTVTTPTGHQVTIRFNHAPHLTELRRGKQLRCVSCHSQIVQGQHIVVTLDTCFLCHFKNVKHGQDDQTIGGCKGCHDEPKKDIQLANGVFNHEPYIKRGVTCQNCHSDSIKGDGAVPRQVCWNCHNQPQQVARYGEPAFIHQAHVTAHKVECSSCHIQIEHSLTAGVPKRDTAPGASHALVNSGTCGQCHDQMHGGPAEIYRGMGARGVPNMPSPMFIAQVDCIACHRIESQGKEASVIAGQTFVAAQASCDYCHGEHYGDVLAAWKKALDANMLKAEVAHRDAEKIVDAAVLPTEAELRARRLLDDAAYNIRLIKLGRGVHNITYATAVLSAAVDQSGQAARVAATMGAKP